MRFVPYVFVAAMALPVLIWVLINNFVVPNSTTFSNGDLGVLVSLGGFMVTAFLLLSRWMSKQVEKSRR